MEQCKLISESLQISSTNLAHILSDISDDNSVLGTGFLSTLFWTVKGEGQNFREKLVGLEFHSWKNPHVTEMFGVASFASLHYVRLPRWH